ncbi:hypothetical protein GOP80_00650 [Planococcaceae bacterium Storch 2/2-2]|nr:hypothetical protein [Planococcaceae bacterium Storch 2/2-2]
MTVYWSDIDLRFIEDVQTGLRRKVGSRYKELFEQSDFVQRLIEEPHYIYHFDEGYWVDYILNDDTE